MKLYQLKEKLRSERILVDVKASTDRMFQFFVFFVTPNGDGKFLQYMNLVGKADFGVKDSDLEKVDFLRALSGGYPLFSERLVSLLKEELGDEMDFFPIEIEAKTIKRPFFVGKINRFLELIDYEKSDTETDQDGNKRLALFGKMVFKENLPDFFIARDSRSNVRWFVSEKMKNLIEKHQLQVNVKLYESFF